MLFSSRATALFLSVAQHLAHLTLNSPMNIDKAECWSLFLEKKRPKIEQKLMLISWSLRGIVESKKVSDKRDRVKIVHGNESFY